MVEELWSGIRMQYSAGQFQLSTDSMVLADFCTLPPRSAVCDLGCGCGSLSLLLCGKYPQAQLTGMELQEEAAALAQENAVQNGLSDRLRTGRCFRTAASTPSSPIRPIIPPGAAASPIPRRWLRRGRSFSARWTISAPARRGCLEAEGVFSLSISRSVSRS